MLRRDHLDRIPGVSHPWFTMVQKSVMVLLAHVQLFLLRRESGGLFWCCDKSRRIPENIGEVSSILVIHILLHWICVVCAVSSQEVLHETIQFVRLDTRGIAHRCHTELSYYSEYL